MKSVSHIPNLFFFFPERNHIILTEGKFLHSEEALAIVCYHYLINTFKKLIPRNWKQKMEMMLGIISMDNQSTGRLTVVLSELNVDKCILLGISVNVLTSS